MKSLDVFHGNRERLQRERERLGDNFEVKANTFKFGKFAPAFYFPCL